MASRFQMSQPRCIRVQLSWGTSALGPAFLKHNAKVFSPPNQLPAAGSNYFEICFQPHLADASREPPPNSTLHRTRPRWLPPREALYFSACGSAPVSLGPLAAEIHVESVQIEGTSASAGARVRVFWKWEPPMPFVFYGLLGPSIFLYGSERDAREGANWGGSGVLVGVPSKTSPSRTHLYAVSNDHVIHSCPVIRLVKVNGDPYVLPGTDADWLSHPDNDDIAIRPLGAVRKSAYWYVPDDLLLSRADLSPGEYPNQISPGDDCFMVGRYINQEQRQFDRPVVRFGNLAMLPEVVYQNERSFWQESFLVDMRSHAGFSGSPVFVYYEVPGFRYLPPEPERPPLPDGSTGLEEQKRMIAVFEEYHRAATRRWTDRDESGVLGRKWLLGIDWGHLAVWDDVFGNDKKKLGRMRVSSGMAGVVPAWKLRDLLNMKEVKLARDKTEEQLSEKDERASVLDTGEADKFAQFEDLTRRLVQVPKRELG